MFIFAKYIYSETKEFNEFKLKAVKYNYLTDICIWLKVFSQKIFFKGADIEAFTKAKDELEALKLQSHYKKQELANKAPQIEELKRKNAALREKVAAKGEALKKTRSDDELVKKETKSLIQEHEKASLELYLLI